MPTPRSIFPLLEHGNLTVLQRGNKPEFDVLGETFENTTTNWIHRDEPERDTREVKNPISSIVETH